MKRSARSACRSSRTSIRGSTSPTISSSSGEKRTYKAKPPGARPTKTFYTKGSMTVGGERLEYGHLGQAHTDGDIYVFLPASNVLVAGDVLSVGTYPIADYTTGGWLGGMVTATKTLIDMSNAETRVIPGTGPVQTRADLQAQHDMLNTMRDRLAKMMRQGMGASDMLAAGATKDFDERWGDPKLFVSVTYRAHVAPRARTGRDRVGQRAKGKGQRLGQRCQGKGIRCAAFS